MALAADEVFLVEGKVVVRVGGAKVTRRVRGDLGGGSFAQFLDLDRALTGVTADQT